MGVDAVPGPPDTGTVTMPLLAFQTYLLNAAAPQLKSHFLQPCTNQPILAGLSGPDF